MLDTKSVRDLEILRKVSDEIAELVREFGGAMTGEHGDGLARSYHNLKLFGPKLFGAFGEVKRLFDPQGILNPGKVAATPSPIENLRYGPAYRGTAVESYLDFRREAEFAEAPGQGFLAAAEMCNGSGVCRKTNSGTMCPSFMVTRDEEHSTRGRANALRLALSGQLPAGALTSQRMFEVMDLCLMCKGCKAECPSNVDVAKLKMEFLAQYYTRHQVPVQTWMTANVAWINRIGSACAPVSNWLPHLMSRQTLQLFSGVDPRRSLPKFYRKSFGKWFRKHRKPAEAGTAGRVVLLDDCLTSHCEPGVNRAAVNVLEAAGYEVVLAGLWCCGRPLISKGLLDSAKSLVRQNVAKLVEYVDQGLPILGSEPSCVLTLADEYPDLFPSEATRRVQRNAFLVEDWLAGRFRDGRSLALQPLAGNALYHGHCQQKAIAGTQGARACLSQIPELKVHEVDSGCCGMAGAFGYDHYEVSMQIGERVLFPTVREHEAGPVVASGFSCRHQIVDGTGRTAVHPLELLAQQLVVPGDG
jgi:Fe-S oxidoreductase